MNGSVSCILFIAPFFTLRPHQNLPFMQSYSNIPPFFGAPLLDIPCMLMTLLYSAVSLFVILVVGLRSPAGQTSLVSGWSLVHSLVYFTTRTRKLTHNCVLFTTGHYLFTGITHTVMIHTCSVSPQATRRGKNPTRDRKHRRTFQNSHW